MRTFRIPGALALGASAVAFLPTAALAGDTTTFSLTGGSLTLSGQGTATLTNAAGCSPPFDVTMPAEALADTYTGIVTTSVV